MTRRSSMILALVIVPSVACSGGVVPADGGSDAIDARRDDAVSAEPDGSSDEASYPDAAPSLDANSDVSVGDAVADAGPLVYRNVVLDVSGDPACVRIGNAYHAYLPDQLAGVMGGRVVAYSSTDLVHWTSNGEVFRNVGESYGGQHATALWAPAVLPFGGTNYLYYVNVMSNPANPTVGDRDIVVISSNDPTDFSHGTGRTVLLDDDGSFIDPSPFVDNDGSLYLVYKRRPIIMNGSHLYIRPMSNPTTFSGAATLLISSSDVPNSEAIVEQPTMVHAGGIYYLLFSTGNGATTTYRIDYATAMNPTGPFTYRGNLFRSDANPASDLAHSVIAPGSSSIVRDGAGATWMVYRQKTTTADTFGDRGVCIDPVTFDPPSHAIHGTPTKGVTRPGPTPLP